MFVVYGHHSSLAHVCYRRNVELKKVNSKYILKSTLTPQMSRKQLSGSSASIDRCQSWPTVAQTDTNSELKFYLGPVSTIDLYNEP
jgi:hypothetical protein